MLERVCVTDPGIISRLNLCPQMLGGFKVPLILTNKIAQIVAAARVAAVANAGFNPLFELIGD